MKKIYESVNQVVLSKWSSMLPNMLTWAYSFKINKITKSLNIFFCKENKWCCYFSFTIYSVFTFGQFTDHNSGRKQENYRSSHPEVFLGKGVLKIRSRCRGENPCQSALSIKLLCNFIEITLQNGCSPVNLWHIFRTPFLKNTSEWLLLKLDNEPIFSSAFPTLFLIFIFVFENSQNSFWCGPFWFLKYLNFGQKLPIQTTHHTFLESRHPEVTKNPIQLINQFVL